MRSTMSSFGEKDTEFDQKPKKITRIWLRAFKYLEASAQLKNGPTDNNETVEDWVGDQEERNQESCEREIR